MSDSGGPSAVRRFSLGLAVVMLLLVTATMGGIYLRTKYLVEEGARAQATSYLDLILTVREWSALHGGVYVSRTKGVRSNPFLRKLGSEPDTVTASGWPLTLRNPAAMTQEISDLTSENDMVSFSLTSLEPVNERNRADEWERRQLKAFVPGSADVTMISSSGSGRVLRLMRPLWAKEECLTCHASRGTQLGDLRGAISVNVSLAEQDEELRRNAVGLGLLWLAMVSGGGAVLYSLVYRLSHQLERSRAHLELLATTDNLTGLANRRVTLERLDAELARAHRESHLVGVIVIDIDHFKSVNDTYGHSAGDSVLVEVAFRMRDAIREYDTLGRVGGEEFVVVAPTAEPADLERLAERIRQAVSSVPVAVADGSTVDVTISAGCSLSQPGEKVGSDVLRRSDRALYEAKAAGRNRVQIDTGT